MSRTYPITRQKNYLSDYYIYFNMTKLLVKFLFFDQKTNDSNARSLEVFSVSFKKIYGS